MTAIQSEFVAAWRTFLRRRSAVVFTFVFPLLIVAIFGALVGTNPGDGGLFAEPPIYYVSGYLAVVVMFTPLSRMGAEVTRHRDANRFEKLATTPLSNFGWLLAHTAVNAVLVLIASGLILAAMWLMVGVRVIPGPSLIVFIVVGVALFCGIGACLGRIARTQDGVIAAANTLGFPMLLLAETFVPLELLPEWFHPIVEVMPLTPFSRGVRAIVQTGDPWFFELLLLSILAVIFLGLGAYLIPKTD